MFPNAYPGIGLIKLSLRRKTLAVSRSRSAQTYNACIIVAITMPYSRVPIFIFVAHYCNLRVYLHTGAVRTQYLAPLISICTLLLILECLGTSMYIGPHTCMSGYVSAYHGVGKLCILLHTVLCHAM